MIETPWGKSVKEIEAMQTQKELELQETSRRLSDVDSEIIDIDKQTIELRLKKKTMEDSAQKGRTALRIINSELREIKNALYDALGKNR